jgi:hypothetical protein
VGFWMVFRDYIMADLAQFDNNSNGQKIKISHFSSQHNLCDTCLANLLKRNQSKQQKENPNPFIKKNTK